MEIKIVSVSQKPLSLIPVCPAALNYFIVNKTCDIVKRGAAEELNYIFKLITELSKQLTSLNFIDIHNSGI